MGLVPKSIHEETKMMFGMSYMRLMGLIMTFMTAVCMDDSVHSWFHIPFIICCVLIYIILNFKAPNNPKRRLWQGMLLYLISKFTPQAYLSVIGYAYKEEKEVKSREKEIEQQPR